MNVTVTGYSRGDDETAGIAHALRAVADALEGADGASIRERIRGAVPTTGCNGNRTATDYDITVSVYP